MERRAGRLLIVSLLFALLTVIIFSTGSEMLASMDSVSRVLVQLAVLMVLYGGHYWLMIASPTVSHKAAGAKKRRVSKVVTDNKQSDRTHGQVKWFNASKGFGFITDVEGEDVFVHVKALRASGARYLSEGQAVEFTVVDSEKGPQAEEIVLL